MSAVAADSRAAEAEEGERPETTPAPAGKKRRDSLPVYLPTTPLTPEEKRETEETHAEFADQRPRTRGDCLGPTGVNRARPCPWAGCLAHLYVDPDPAKRTAKINFPGQELWEVKGDTCALDVADRVRAARMEEMPHAEIAKALGTSDETARLDEHRAIAKLSKRLKR